jgi:disulfide bond formation protein DsbB
MFFSNRTEFFLGFLACFSMLAVGAYFQLVEELEPCPLCISQRIATKKIEFIFVLVVLNLMLQGQ